MLAENLAFHHRSPRRLADAVLLVDRERRERLGTAASRFVRGERTLTVAADILGRALKPVLAIRSA